jgi:predicted chitinase
MPSENGQIASHAPLSASVGKGQPNRPADVLTVQKLLNALIGDGFAIPLKRLEESSSFDGATEQAIHVVEREYFDGIADPFHRVEPGGEIHRFLTHVAEETHPSRPRARLSEEMYGLAKVMVPGGADHLVKHKVKAGHIRTYLPAILAALDQANLGDLDMALMALATIRAETAGFVPIPEGVTHDRNVYNKKKKRNELVKGNTSDEGTDGGHDFDRYDNRTTDLGNLGDPDGADFKGRGFVQLTGRANYTRLSHQLRLGDQLIRNPEKADDPELAARILAQYLANNAAAIRKALAAGDLRHARRLVNGGSNGFTEFVKAFNAGRKYFHLAAIKAAKQKAKAGKKPLMHHHPSKAAHK